MSDFPSHLLDGYSRFASGRFASEQAVYHTLAREGQKPPTMVIGCCDSRVAPETVFDCGPGEIFVVRNIANVVPVFAPDDKQNATAAGIEYAVTALKVGHIVVMGHSSCGGIAASLSPDFKPLDDANFVGKWLEPLEPVKAQIDDTLAAPDRQRTMEHLSIRNSVANLQAIPYVAARVQSGELAIHGVWFEIETGALWVMDEKTGAFVTA